MVLKSQMKERGWEVLRNTKTLLQGHTASKQRRRHSSPELTGFSLTCGAVCSAHGASLGLQGAAPSRLWMAPQ